MPNETPAAAATAPARRPYFGSCHCGATLYVAYLTLPPPLIQIQTDPKSSIRIRKCNCSTSHKTSFFHVRLPDAPNDFALLYPADPISGLSDYTCMDKRLHWYFCPACGVRCFTFAGEAEVREVNVPGEGGRLRNCWTPKREGWDESKSGSSYLSVNAATLEPGQHGLDPREWTEKKWSAYFDFKDCKYGGRFGEPHLGGTY